MLLCVLDTETTGTNPEEDTITEVAVAIYDTKSKSVLSSLSFLIPTDVISDEIQRITHITPEITKEIPATFSGVLFLDTLIDSSHAIIAHNAEFDKPFTTKYLTPFNEKIVNKPWVCSYKDLEFNCPSNKLGYMCTDLGLPVQGSHRAMSDVIMLCNLLKTVDNLEDQVNTVLTVPPVIITANVSFEDKDKAKSAGFSFNPKTKKWTKRVRKSPENLGELLKSFNFSTTACIE